MPGSDDIDYDPFAEVKRLLADEQNRFNPSNQGSSGTDESHRNDINVVISKTICGPAGLRQLSAAMVASCVDERTGDVNSHALSNALWLLLGEWEAVYSHSPDAHHLCLQEMLQVMLTLIDDSLHNALYIHSKRDILDVLIDTLSAHPCAADGTDNAVRLLTDDNAALLLSVISRLHDICGISKKHARLLLHAPLTREGNWSPMGARILKTLMQMSRCQPTIPFTCISSREGDEIGRTEADSIICSHGVHQSRKSVRLTEFTLALWLRVGNNTHALCNGHVIATVLKAASTSQAVICMQLQVDSEGIRVVTQGKPGSAASSTVLKCSLLPQDREKFLHVCVTFTRGKSLLASKPEAALFINGALSSTQKCSFPHDLDLTMSIAVGSPEPWLPEAPKVASPWSLRPVPLTFSQLAVWSVALQPEGPGKLYRLGPRTLFSPVFVHNEVTTLICSDGPNVDVSGESEGRNSNSHDDVPSASHLHLVLHPRLLRSKDETWCSTVIANVSSNVQWSDDRSFSSVIGALGGWQPLFALAKCALQAPPMQDGSSEMDGLELIFWIFGELLFCRKDLIEQYVDMDGCETVLRCLAEADGAILTPGIAEAVLHIGDALLRALHHNSTSRLKRLQKTLLMGKRERLRHRVDQYWHALCDGRIWAYASIETNVHFWGELMTRIQQGTLEINDVLIAVPIDAIAFAFHDRASSKLVPHHYAPDIRNSTSLQAVKRMSSQDDRAKVRSLLQQVLRCMTDAPGSSISVSSLVNRALGLAAASDSTTSCDLLLMVLESVGPHSSRWQRTVSAILRNKHHIAMIKIFEDATPRLRSVILYTWSQLFAASPSASAFADFVAANGLYVLDAGLSTYFCDNASSNGRIDSACNVQVSWFRLLMDWCLKRPDTWSESDLGEVFQPNGCLSDYFVSGRQLQTTSEAFVAYNGVLALALKLFANCHDTTTSAMMAMEMLLVVKQGTDNALCLSDITGWQSSLLANFEGDSSFDNPSTSEQLLGIIGSIFGHVISALGRSKDGWLSVLESLRRCESRQRKSLENQMLACDTFVSCMFSTLTPALSSYASTLQQLPVTSPVRPLEQHFRTTLASILLWIDRQFQNDEDSLHSFFSAKPYWGSCEAEFWAFVANIIQCYHTLCSRGDSPVGKTANIWAFDTTIRSYATFRGIGPVAWRLATAALLQTTRSNGKNQQPAASSAFPADALLSCINVISDGTLWAVDSELMVPPRSMSRPGIGRKDTAPSAADVLASARATLANSVANHKECDTVDISNPSGSKDNINVKATAIASLSLLWERAHALHEDSNFSQLERACLGSVRRLMLENTDDWNQCLQAVFEEKRNGSKSMPSKQILVLEEWIPICRDLTLLFAQFYHSIGQTTTGDNIDHHDGERAIQLSEAAGSLHHAPVGLTTFQALVATATSNKLMFIEPDASGLKVCLDDYGGESVAAEIHINKVQGALGYGDIGSSQLATINALGEYAMDIASLREFHPEAHGGEALKKSKYGSIRWKLGDDEGLARRRRRLHIINGQGDYKAARYDDSLSTAPSSAHSSVSRPDDKDIEDSRPRSLEALGRQSSFTKASLDEAVSAAKLNKELSVALQRIQSSESASETNEANFHGSTAESISNLDEDGDTDVEADTGSESMLSLQGGDISLLDTSDASEEVDSFLSQSGDESSGPEDTRQRLAESPASDSTSDSEWVSLSSSAETSGPDEQQLKGALMTCQVTMVTTLSDVDGTLVLTRDRITMFPSHLTANSGRPSWDQLPKRLVWPVQDVVEVHGRRFLHEPTAIELFLSGGLAGVNSHEHWEKLVRLKGVFLNFLDAETGVSSSKVRQTFYNRLKMCRGRRNLSICYLNSPEKAFSQSGIQQRWLSGEVSNFDYLMALNTFSGRSFNDLRQYPVFPWILGDYTSDSIDLADPSVYRDLSRPIGVQSDRMADMFRERYDGWSDPVIPKFHYGSHYSTPGYVLFYLLRLEPFTHLHVQLQSGSFDCPDRLFHCMQDLWKSSTESMSDVKELIPEFYDIPEMFMNEADLPLGRRQKGETLDDVALPPWANNSPRRFVRIMRDALESPIASQGLPKWIDLVFGCSQRGPRAETNINVFFYLTYPFCAPAVSSITDPQLRKATQEQIASFGQTPAQLMSSPHPSKNTADGSSTFSFDLSKSLDGLSVFALSKITELRKSASHTKPIALSHCDGKLFVVDGTGSVEKHSFNPSLPDHNQDTPFTCSPDSGLKSDPGLVSQLIRRSRRTSTVAAIQSLTASRVGTENSVGVIEDSHAMLGARLTDLYSGERVAVMQRKSGTLFAMGGLWQGFVAVVYIGRTTNTQHLIVKGMTTSVAWLSDGLVAGLGDGSLRVWGFAKPHSHTLHNVPIMRIAGPDSPVQAICGSSEWHWLAAGGQNGELHLMTKIDGVVQHVLRTEGNINAIKETKDGDILVLSDGGSVMSLYSLNGRLVGKQNMQQESPVTAVYVSIIHDTILTGHADGAVNAWDSTSLTLAGEVCRMPHKITAVSQTSSSNDVLVGLSDGSLHFVCNMNKLTQAVGSALSSALGMI